MKILFVLFVFIATIWGQSKPNIILIMTDDMGYSDLGCYGSEIETPHIDNLAKKGLRFTKFYNTSRCCPTRASLMTGLYSHQAGIGAMTRDRGPKFPAYRGHLTENCVTIAEVLKTVGYSTIQTGKWHLGDKREWWPDRRGFDHMFSSPLGGGFYFKPANFKMKRVVVRDEELLYDQKNHPPEGWYTTDAYTDEGLKFVQKAVEKGQPFFWYLAYNAPHFPLKAKKQDIDKYRGKYLKGWDVIRQERYERLLNLGIIQENWKLSTRDSEVPAWNELDDSEKTNQDLRMATYAAMIDCIDQNIGKLVQHLKKLNVYEDTLIFFLHDNGGCGEGGVMGVNKGEGECGTEKSFAYYGKCWANVSDTPFQKYKAEIFEGGIATPLIAHWPRRISKPSQGSLIHESGHVMDIMATCIEISGAQYPMTFNGKDIKPLEGRSLSPYFSGKSYSEDRPLYFEHFGKKGMMQGDWKIVGNKQDWKLFNMKNDRTETQDLTKEYPEKVQLMSHLYDIWAEKCQVISR
jgi:arylsulfatase